MTDNMVVQRTINVPKALDERFELIRAKLNEPSGEDLIIKLITGGLILIERELERRDPKLIQEPQLVGPDGQYIGRRTV